MTLFQANIIGDITPPKGVSEYGAEAGNIGILAFFSNLFRLGIIVAGLWVLYNFFQAGFMYITGDSASTGKAKDKMTWSVVGLLVLMATYTIMALLGSFFFGEASFFLQPEIVGPGGS